jgi:hypothetical protein
LEEKELIAVLPRSMMYGGQIIDLDIYPFSSTMNQIHVEGLE